MCVFHAIEARETLRNDRKRVAARYRLFTGRGRTGFACLPVGGWCALNDELPAFLVNVTAPFQIPQDSAHHLA